VPQPRPKFIIETPNDDTELNWKKIAERVKQLRKAPGTTSPKPSQTSPDKQG
jgi:hypothetical protein